MTEDMILDKQIVAPLPPQGDGNRDVNHGKKSPYDVAPLPPQGDGNHCAVAIIYRRSPMLHLYPRKGTETA